MTSLVKYSTSPRNAEHSPKVSLEQGIGNRRAERLRINGSAKFNICASYQHLC